MLKEELNRERERSGRQISISDDANCRIMLIKVVIVSSRDTKSGTAKLEQK